MPSTPRSQPPRRPRRALVLPWLATLVLAGCVSAGRPDMPSREPAPVPLAHGIVPVPASVRLGPDSFTIDSATAVVIDAAADAEVEDVARQLLELLALAPARAPRRAPPGEVVPRSIRLTLDATRTTLGAEGYELEIARDGVTLAAARPAGLFYGVQTLRQLLPVSLEHRAAVKRVLRMPTGRIVDVPRFGWRGAMLDVSRHFLPAADVKRFIDVMALYKLNRLHLHLADDQGWRIEIRSWPNLATHGGSTQVGGGAGGYYTQATYADIVAHARRRFITVVPEIDMPGHTNAALASYPELNCDGRARPLYTGIAVGFSALCVERDTVYAFIDDVVREVSALTPGPYLHVGGDEVERLTEAQYRAFVERVQGIVGRHGKRMIGWTEIAAAELHPSTIVQHWRTKLSHLKVARTGQVIMSPAARAYLDMKYDSSTVLGLSWAGLVEVRDAYDWEPTTLLENVPGDAVIGVEGPLWSETLEKREDVEFMALPRLAALAEVAWSPIAARDWEDFRLRLGAHGPRLSALGVNFYRSPQIPWRLR